MAAWAAPELVGQSPAFVRMIEQAREVLEVDVGVLICGEAGAGKTALADAIVRNSARGLAGPIVQRNVQTLPYDRLLPLLREATNEARGGTLVLDDVLPLDRAARAWLGEVLVQWTAEVRVIATTQRVDERIDGTIAIHVPSLAERREDIALIAADIVRRGRYRVPPFEISDEALAACAAEVWSGNVRELEQVLDRSRRAARIEGRERIEVGDLALV